MKTLFSSSRREEAHFIELLDTRPHSNPLPQGEGTGTVRFEFCGKLSGESSCMIFFETTNITPSPRGEGRGEGGCCH
jgi:hypothetical protein